MPARVPTTAVLLLLLSTAVLCQATPASPTVAKSSGLPAVPPADTALPQPASDAGAAATTQSHTLFFYTSPRSTVEMAVHSIPATNRERLQRLRDDFATVDCSGNRMKEEPVPERGGESGANLICVWPGSGQGTIVIAAHYDHEGRGQGALDDWSGAALLPFLYQAIQGQPRENSYVFLEAWKRQGAETWFKSLSHADRRRIRAMIDLDGLGLSYTRFFTTFSPFETSPPSAAHLQVELLWAALDEGLTQAPEQTSPHHWLSVDSTDPFRSVMVPTIVIHSIPEGEARIPGSAADVASAVDGNAYYQTYHLMCAYLTALDRVADKLDSHDRIWDSGAPNLEPEQETPMVTFRQFNHGRIVSTQSTLPPH